MVETRVQHFFCPLFDFADVNQHPIGWINFAAENKKGDIVSAGAVTRAGFRSKGGQVLFVSPIRTKEPAGSGKLQPLADSQQHRCLCYCLSKARNSPRVRASSLKLPRRHEVFMTEFCFSTPLIIMERCFASITTAAPLGCRHFISASAIWVVRFS